jgi:hypothetical protein
MKFRLLALLVSSLWFHPAAAEELPDYIRYAEDAKTSRLEVAIRTFTLPSGQNVDLMAVIHIADDSYYQQLNSRFPAYDSVLFELVGDPKRLTESAPLTAEERKVQPVGSGVSFIQQSAGKYLNLTFQLGAVDYRGKNMVHADTSPAEFEKMQAERGESMLTLFTRAMQVQMNGSINSAAMNELDTFALIRILLSPNSAAEFKMSLAKMFDQMESITVAMEGKNPTAILGGRNDVVMAKLTEVLANRKQRRIAVFFGGGHMPGIERALVAEMKAKPVGEEWLPAWTMRKAAPNHSAGGDSTRAVPAGQ